MKGDEINREEFVCQLVDKYGYTKKAATELTSAFLDTIMDNMENGNTVSFYGFGTFGIKNRAERTVKEPNAGEICVIPEHLLPKFVPGKRMKMAVRRWEIIKDRE